MSNNILKDFFYGNINPNEKQFDRNSEYGKALAGLVGEEEKLRPLLSEDASAILDRLLSLQSAVMSLTAEAHFIDGLRMGFQFAAAALADEDRPFLRPVADAP